LKNLLKCLLVGSVILASVSFASDIPPSKIADGTYVASAGSQSFTKAIISTNNKTHVRSIHLWNANCVECEDTGVFPVEQNVGSGGDDVFLIRNPITNAPDYMRNTYLVAAFVPNNLDDPSGIKIAGIHYAGSTQDGTHTANVYVSDALIKQ
jgi:hypothetical protein